MYNLKTKTTVISRDVCSHERCFPFRFSNIDQTPMKHLFIPRSNYPIDATETSDVEYTKQNSSQLLDQADHYVSPRHQDSNSDSELNPDPISNIPQSLPRPTRIKTRPVHLQITRLSLSFQRNCTLVQLNSIPCPIQHT